jgi:hypothetical protein
MVCDENEYNTGSSPGYAAGSAGTPASVGSDPDSYDGLNNILHAAQANGGGQLVLPTATDYIGTTGKSFDYCPAFEERTNGDRVELQNNHALYDCAAVSGSYKTSRQRMCWCSTWTEPTPVYFFGMTGNSADPAFNSGDTEVVVNYNAHEIDPGGVFDATTGVFTAPRTATYQFFARVEVGAWSPAFQYITQSHLYYSIKPSGSNSWTLSNTQSSSILGGAWTSKVYDGGQGGALGGTPADNITPIHWSLVQTLSSGDQLRVAVQTAVTSGTWKWSIIGGSSFGGHNLT